MDADAAAAAADDVVAVVPVVAASTVPLVLVVVFVAFVDIEDSVFLLSDCNLIHSVPNNVLVLHPTYILVSVK